MARTYAMANMSFIDVSALGDADEAYTGHLSLSNKALLKEDIQTKSYGTLEKNQFVLNGSKSIMPDSPTDIVFWSKYGSDTSNEQSGTEITISFDENHTSAGITLFFGDNYPLEVDIEWFSLLGSSLSKKTFYPTSNVFYCRNQVQNYGKIKITFKKASFPGRKVKLNYILYGAYLDWQDDLISSAKVVEEVDTTSETLSVNTLSMTIVDEKNDFDIANNDGEWKSVQQNQQVHVSEYVDGTIINMGTFYMDKWSFSNNNAKFELIDSIGFIDKTKFYEGKIYKNEKAFSIATAIFNACGFTDWSMDNELKNITLSGHLGIMSCREALQKLCFSIGACADCDRNGYIRITRPLRYISTQITTSRKFYGKTTVSLGEYVSGVTIGTKKYTLSSETQNIYDDILSKGTNRIEFNSPVDPTTIAVSGGNLEVAKTNYCVVTMPSTKQCTITAKKYDASDFSISTSVDKLDSGEVENIKEFTCELYNTSLIPENAERLLDFYSLRKNVKLKYLAGSERVGDWASIHDMERNMSATLIQKQAIDLAGGYIADAECVGYSKIITDFYYTGTELYTGGWLI